MPWIPSAIAAAACVGIFIYILFLRNNKLFCDRCERVLEIINITCFACGGMKVIRSSIGRADKRCYICLGTGKKVRCPRCDRE